MTRRVIIEADGGSRGNPGPSGYGAVVRDADTGELLAEVSEGLGTTTNNVAEYSGLIAGLRAAVKEGALTAEARLDSKLVVEQMSGRWQIKQPHLRPLAGEAAELARQLGDVSYTWVPRARNAHADRLANEAMDAQAGVTSKPGTHTAAPTHWTGATGTPTRLLMLRHGQTERSAQRRYSGRADLPLTELGERQAAAAAARLALTEGVAAVVSSPLLRARQTAQPVADALGVPLTFHEGLIETDFGAWDGLTFAEAQAQDPDLHTRWLTDTSAAPPGGESMDEVHRRVRRVRDQLIAEHGAETLIVVSHVTPIKALLRMALDAGPSLLHRLHLDVASLSIAEFYPDGPATVRLVNDTGHVTNR
ncbi:MAG: bifunctional RNase H/acid phosphatase [Pseudonocardiales bacterium]|nr:bifunctional RNase H/acid phosphatase [Actinomycetota bacterium]PZS24328.1 MAG: bifunctional RNase H/acid phosphatase [Pseudonocardiales bacterium]